jgi:acetyl-CoA synthetase
MLGNQVELWETVLAAMKLGAVIIPATTLLGPADWSTASSAGTRATWSRGSATRRSSTRCRATTRGSRSASRSRMARVCRGRRRARRVQPDGPTQAADPLLLYFTSGTTAKPKLVEHTHASTRSAPLDDVLDRAAARATCT